MEIAVFLVFLGGLVAAVREGARPGHFAFCAGLLTFPSAAALHATSDRLTLLTIAFVLPALLALAARFAHERRREQFRVEDVHFFYVMFGLGIASWSALVGFFLYA